MTLTHPVVLLFTIVGAAPEIATTEQLSSIKLPALEDASARDKPIDVDIDAPEIVLVGDAIYLSRLPRDQKRLKKVMEIGPDFDGRTPTGA
jgi:hypothetical protein